ncbi:MAG TPA: hypothetical protein VHE83_16720, partial [Mycobacteriales bacterium]|nr:hypothetical protein [Mycobacteriales bacterium]
PGLTRPLRNLDGCYNDADVNAAVWLLLSDGSQIEIGYTVDSCGPPGRLLAYRYVAVTDQALDQQLLELDRRGVPTDSLLDHFMPNNAGHTYAVQRSPDPHVWLFELDGRVVHRWRSSTVLTVRTAEVGVESYAPFARVRVKFGHLAVQRGAGWATWQTDHIATTGRMSGSNGVATWNAREN